MNSPSGVHSGETYRLPLPWVTCVVSFKSKDMIQTLSPPLRSETNATFLPSGLKRGCMSYARPLVSRVAAPPVIGMV